MKLMKQACFDKKNDTPQKSARTTLPKNPITERQMSDGFY